MILEGKKTCGSNKSTSTGTIKGLEVQQIGKKPSKNNAFLTTVS